MINLTTWLISQLIAYGIRLIDSATIDQFIQIIDSTIDWFREWNGFHQLISLLLLFLGKFKMVGCAKKASA